MKLLLFTFLVPAASGFTVSSTTTSMVSSSETVDYVCEMTNMWSTTNHPINYPASSAHWSPPVLAAHGSAYTMWEAGGMASTGVENVAELGSTGSLNSELTASANVGDVVIGQNAFNNQITTQTFSQLEMDSTNKYFSMVSMVAPSPDWFTGFYNFEAIKASTDTWYREFVIVTFPWDAGTENGDTYSLGNAATNPQEPISQLTVNTVPSNGVLLSPDGTTVRPVSSFTCTLQQPDPNVPPPSEELFDPFDVVSKKLSLVVSTNTVDYTCVFQNNWSATNHPNLYPGSAHWSSPILAAHGTEYSMWEEGGIASSGVESVAETGGTSSLNSELDAFTGVGARETGSPTFNSQIQMQAFDSIELTPDTSLLSTITMIAPSPDWFSGFYNFDAIDGVTNTWYREFVIGTYAWDAGTEDGDRYSGSNPATSPTEPIKRFNPNNLPGTNVFLSTSGTVLPVAIWTCTLEQPDPVVGFPTCFSSRVTVEIEGKGKVSMDQLQIGDQVRVDDTHFEPVYSFGHKSKTEIGSYLQIFADGLKDPLEISKDHMLFLNVQNNKKAVPASMVKTGDFLVTSSRTSSRVTKVSTIERRGAFAPFTMSGTIVVNGVVSSSYVSLQGTDNVMIGNTKTPFGNHFIAHLLITPLRFMARFGLLNQETYTSDGRSRYIAGPHYIAELLLKQSPALFGTAFSVAVALTTPLLAIEFLLARYYVCFLGIAAAWYFYRKVSFKKSSHCEH